MASTTAICCLGIEAISTAQSGRTQLTTNGYRMGDRVDPELRRWYVDQQGAVPAWFLAKLFELCAQLDLSDRLPLLAVPTLAINGSEGRQAPVDCVRSGVATMPNARLQVLDGLPFNVMTIAPERCAALTLDFLGEVDRISPPADERLS